jgi:hypothetical protein
MVEAESHSARADRVSPKILASSRRYESGVMLEQFKNYAAISHVLGAWILSAPSAAHRRWPLATVRGADKISAPRPYISMFLLTIIYRSTP